MQQAATLQTPPTYGQMMPMAGVPVQSVVAAPSGIAPPPPPMMPQASAANDAAVQNAQAELAFQQEHAAGLGEMVAVNGGGMVAQAMPFLKGASAPLAAIDGVTSAIGADRDRTRLVEELIHDYRNEIAAECHVRPENVQEQHLLAAVASGKHQFSEIKEILDNADNNEFKAPVSGLASGGAFLTAASIATGPVGMAAGLAASVIAGFATDGLLSKREIDSEGMEQKHFLERKLAGDPENEVPPQPITALDIANAYQVMDKDFAGELEAHYGDWEALSDDQKTHAMTESHKGMWQVCQAEAELLNSNQMTPAQVLTLEPAEVQQKMQMFMASQAPQNLQVMGTSPVAVGTLPRAANDPMYQPQPVSYLPSAPVPRVATQGAQSEVMRPMQTEIASA